MYLRQTFNMQTHVNVRRCESVYTSIHIYIREYLMLEGMQFRLLFLQVTKACHWLYRCFNAYFISTAATATAATTTAATTTATSTTATTATTPPTSVMIVAVLILAVSLTTHESGWVPF